MTRSLSARGALRRLGALTLTHTLTLALISVTRAAPPSSANPPQDPPPSPAPSPTAARRVFAVDLDGDGHDELLCAQGDALTAYAVQPDGALGEERWRARGAGEAHMIAEGMIAEGALGGARALLVAWGQGVGQLNAPLTLTAIDPATGAARELWRHAGPRSQAVSLSLSRDPSGAPAVRVAHFVSKYHTREVTLSSLPLSSLPLSSLPLSSLSPSSSAPPATAQASPQLRMGTSWLHADVDADGREDLVVGRVYGEEQGEYGDLLVTLAHPNGPSDPSGPSGAAEPLVIPTARGVKGLWWGRWDPSDQDPALYIADGWVAAYGKRARAHLRRLRWRDGRPSVESLLSLPGEYTLFDIFERADPDAEGSLRLFAQASGALYLLEPRAVGQWGALRLADLPPVVNVAVARAHGDWWLALPAQAGVTLRPLRLPPLPRVESP